MDINLTPQEKATLVFALAACTQSGGGSSSWTLCRKLSEAWAVELDPTPILHLQQIAHKEFVGE